MSLSQILQKNAIRHYVKNGNIYRDIYIYIGISCIYLVHLTRQSGLCCVI